MPYWWDGTKESLAATIRETRPDLLISLGHLTGKHGYRNLNNPIFWKELKSTIHPNQVKNIRRK